MFQGNARMLAAALATSAALSLPTGCASTRSAGPALGTPAERHSHDRTVLIRPNTKVVNVDGGEVITFIVREPDGTERSFTWNFDIARETVGDLRTIAPAGMLDRPVRVVVAPSARY
jgi:heavy-metal resistance protein CzcE